MTFSRGTLIFRVPQLENVISEGIIHQKIVRSARGMSLEHSKTCGTCSAGGTYSLVNRVWQNAGYLRRCLLLNLHKVEVLEILTLMCAPRGFPMTPPPEPPKNQSEAYFSTLRKIYSEIRRIITNQVSCRVTWTS